MENNPDVIQFISMLHQFIRLETHTLVYIRMTHRKLKVTPLPLLDVKVGRGTRFV